MRVSTVQQLKKDGIRDQVHALSNIFLKCLGIACPGARVTVFLSYHSAQVTELEHKREKGATQRQVPERSVFISFGVVRFGIVRSGLWSSQQCGTAQVYDNSCWHLGGGPEAWARAKTPSPGLAGKSECSCCHLENFRWWSTCHRCHALAKPGKGGTRGHFEAKGGSWHCLFQRYALVGSCEAPSFPAPTELSPASGAADDEPMTNSLLTRTEALDRKQQLESPSLQCRSFPVPPRNTNATPHAHAASPRSGACFQ